MPSPFPGMNPYLEQDDVWHDFHDSFIPRMRDVLNLQVGPEYVVKVDEHIYIQEMPVDPREVHPTIVDEWHETYLTIRDRRSWEVITVIELLSPSNKVGRDREQYVHKRNEILQSSAHLVELDMLRGGRRMPFDDLPDCDYYVLIGRQEARPGAKLVRIGLRQELPTIPVPLRAGDADAEVNLQELLHQQYDAAGYAKFIYRGQPDPPLFAEDAEWAQQFLPAST